MEEKENKMIKDRKIKILTEQVESMRKRIEELESENKMLYEQIIIQQDVEHENVKQMNDVLADLYKKHDEYDDLNVHLLHSFFLKKIFLSGVYVFDHV